MKTLKYIMIAAAFLGLAACEERTPEHFADVTGVYFNNTTGLMSVTDSLDLTFVYEASDVMEVPVKVQLLGRAVDYDRPLDISVTSDNAEAGRDFILPAEPVLPAGASSMDYVVTLLRTDALKTQKKSLTLELHGNEHFSLHVSELAQISDTVSVVSFRIFFSDMFTTAPSAWDEKLIGKFTQQKFELICKVLEINPADFNDPAVITLAKLLYIATEMTAYVQDQAALKAAGEAYDTEAFDPATGEPLTFR